MTEGERDIYLARHGRLDKDPERSYVGQTDYPLSSSGRAQAEVLQDALAGIKFSRIVSSDLQRTLATAEIIAQGQDVDVEKNPAFREVSLGAWEGVRVTDIKTRHPQAYEARGLDLAGHRPPGGESFEDVSRRALPAFDRLRESGPGPTLIVTHVGVIRVLLCRVLGMPLNNLFRLTQDYGAYSLLQFHKGTYRLVRYNCTARPEEIPVDP